MTKSSSLPIILIITQSSSRVSFFEKNLSGKFVVLESPDEASAIERLEYEEIDCVILDEKNDKISIFPFCKKIRTRSEYKEIPILVITKTLKKAILKQILHAGATGILHEPLDKRALFQELDAAFYIVSTKKKMSQLSNAIKKVPESKSLSPLKKPSPLDNHIIQIVQESQKNKIPLTFLLIELDQHDKQTKEILFSFKKKLKSLLRQQDTLFTFADGKFLFILRKTSQRAALLIAENIQEELKDSPLMTKEGPQHFTASIGLADLKEAGKNPYFYADQLYMLASRALSEAKQKGNRIITSQKGKVL